MTHSHALNKPTTHAVQPQQIRDFVHTHIIPHELTLSTLKTNTDVTHQKLQCRAKQQGLYGSFYPPSLGGRFTRLHDYLPIAEEEGRSEYGPFIFGAESTVDIHMLHKYGNSAIQQSCVVPIARGDITASYAMTEPDTSGSVPDTLQASAVLKDGHWHIQGKKWFICRADKSKFIAVVVCTDPDQVLAKRLSVILVPVDTPGVQNTHNIHVFGQHNGQCELAFNNIKVPESFLLGSRGEGLAIIGHRLKLGRILRSTHWLGLAQRCYDVMCQRIHSERGSAIGLANKQLVRQHTVNVYQALASTRALLRTAATELDNHLPANIAVNLAKLSASHTLNLAADCAVQLFGAEGLSDRTPLASIFQTARTTRILDGADEALISSIGKDLLEQTKPNDGIQDIQSIAPLYFHKQSNYLPHE